MRSTKHRHVSPPGIRDDETLEMTALVREQRGVIDQFRIRCLDAHLRESPRAVAHSAPGFCGDRLTLVLDDRSVLKLHLYWPEHRPFARLDSIRWSDADGWVVVGASICGDPLRCQAWKASLELPPREP